MVVERVGSGGILQPEPPCEGIRRNRGLEIAGALGRDGFQSAPAASVRRQRAEILHIDLAGEQAPCRARVGLHQDIPHLPRAAAVGEVAQEAVVAREGGAVGIGVPQAVHVRKCILPDIEVGLARKDFQRRAPGIQRGRLGGELEIVGAAIRVEIGKDLASRFGRSGVPGQLCHMDIARKEAPLRARLRLH